MSYHTYLLLTNQTTWERNKESAIDYLKVYPKGYQVFDKGMVQNLALCCCLPDTPISWQIPDIEEAWDNPKPCSALNNKFFNYIC